MEYIGNTSKKRIMYYKFSKKCPKFIRKRLDAEKCYWSPKHRKNVKEMIAGFKNDSIRNIDVWKKAYRDLCYKDTFYVDEAKSFFNCKVEAIKTCPEKPGDGVILLLVVKNDLERVKLLIDYYRKNGVERFAVLDDKSDDGTREFLMGEPDVDVYASDVNYSTKGRQAWLARLVDIYGFDKWYLIVDADELLSYVGMDKLNIKALAKKMDVEGRTALRMMLLEMYPDGDILTMPPVDVENIMSVYNYFDSKEYRLKYMDVMSCVVGGVRCRYFYDNNFKEAPYLTKYPLVKIRPGMIPCHSHMNFPFEYNKDLPLSGCLLHYKFLPQDIDKYKKRVQSGNFASGSKEYVKYFELMQKNGALNLYEAGTSVEYESPESLKILGVEQF